MTLKSLSSIVLLLTLFLPEVKAQTKFQISPYFQGVTSVKDGIVEMGPEFSKDSLKTDRKSILKIRPYFRLPISDKDNNILRLDRFTSTLRFIVAIDLINDYDIHAHSQNGKSNRTIIQVEIGRSRFEYFPTGNKNNKLKDPKTSFAFELKRIWDRLGTSPAARQRSYQFRLRYTKDYKEADKVGVLQGPNSNGVQFTTDMVIDRPTVKPLFSPAFAIFCYKGSGNFGFIPALYLDFTGNKNKSDPFSNLLRARMEYWITYFPIIAGTPNVSIGVSPLINARIKGKDDFRALEYGLQFRFVYTGNMLKFL